MGDSQDPLLEAIERLTVTIDSLRAEMRAGRSKKARTRRVKAIRNAAQAADVPVSDIAAMAARRALARSRSA